MKQTHRSLISALMLAGMLTPALMLTGCLDGSGSTASISSVQAAKADVGISVEFPAAGASAARIDDNTTAVLVQVWDATNTGCQDYGCYGEPTKSVRLERPAGGGTVSASLLGVSTGEAIVRVTQLNVDGDTETALETVNVAAKLIEGKNSMTVTLLRAAWTLQTPVTFNKIVTTDTTRVDSFSLVPSPYYTQAQAAATSNVDVYGVMNVAIADEQLLLRGVSSYATIVKGSNLCSYDDYGGYGGSGSPITCGQTQLASSYYQEDGLAYFNRHDSADASHNFALLSASNDLPLAYDSQERERGWAAYSLGSDNQFLTLFNSSGPGGDTASDPDVWKDFNIAVTGGSTIQGNFIEWLSKSMTEGTRKCYSDYQLTTEITCPAQAVAAKASVKHGKSFLSALGKAVAKAKASPGKAAADAQGCYRDLVLSYKDYEYGGYILENDAYMSWYYGWDVSETIDACRHPFTATASQLTQADVDLVQVPR